MLDRYCDCCWKKKRASRAFWKPRHHIPDTILWLWILCWIKWRGTLTSPDSTDSLEISHTCTHKNHEFAQALCASWKTIVLQEACSWRHMYGEGRQPPGLAHIDRSCDWPEKTITREITSPSYLPIMIIHKSVTAALNFDQPTPHPEQWRDSRKVVGVADLSEWHYRIWDRDVEQYLHLQECVDSPAVKVLP